MLPILNSECLAYTLDQPIVIKIMKIMKIIIISKSLMYLGYTNGLLFHCFMYTCSVPIINTIELICIKRRRREEGRKENAREEKGGKIVEG